jgi:hypothetical protein
MRTSASLAAAQTGSYAGDVATLATIAGVLKKAGVEFIDENGGEAGVRLRKRSQRRELKE